MFLYLQLSKQKNNQPKNKINKKQTEYEWSDKTHLRELAVKPG